MLIKDRKTNDFFKRITVFVLIVVICICSTSCNAISTLFYKMSDEEWESAMNPNNFNNVTMEFADTTVQVVDGTFYDNGVALKNDGTDLLLRVIVELFNNCQKENFYFTIASTYVCAKIDYTFDFVATDIDDGLDVTIVATAENIAVQFDSDNKVSGLACELSFTIMGPDYEEPMNDLSISVLFTNYGTTVVE
jgi:hypothetical protein